MDWSSVLQAFQNFFATIIAFLPTLLAVLILLLIAWILAKLLRTGVHRLLKASGIDKRLGKGGVPYDDSQYPVARGAGMAVFWIVWILFILAILQVLGVEGIFDSIVLIFQAIFAAIPRIIGAVVILAVAYLIGRLLVKLATKALARISFDELPVKLGLAKEPVEGVGSPTNVVGYIIMLFIMLFAVIMAADLLEFALVNELVGSLTQFLGQVLLGVVIIGVGIFVANFVVNILRAGGRSESAASFVRVAIIVLSVVLGMRAMGFADDLIMLGFGLALGAAAVAAAIAFGLGGRHVAGELLARWTKTGSGGGRGDEKAKK
ncbi:MAG: mechanosensitive ion channel [Dehalococcoidia bacterium]